MIRAQANDFYYLLIQPHLEPLSTQLSDEKKMSNFSFGAVLILSLQLREKNVFNYFLHWSLYSCCYRFSAFYV